MSIITKYRVEIVFAIQLAFLCYSDPIVRRFEAVTL